ncbi:hypothetical protein B0H11DRAFT_688117 [Mycena galericulata]|nr:hypothetical protein B0H11DRAFT_688117 [Mycena galericulata]
MPFVRSPTVVLSVRVFLWVALRGSPRRFGRHPSLSPFISTWGGNEPWDSATPEGAQEQSENLTAYPQYTTADSLFGGVLSSVPCASGRLPTSDPASTNIRRKPYGHSELRPREAFRS